MAFNNHSNRRKPPGDEQILYISYLSDNTISITLSLFKESVNLIKSNRKEESVNSCLD